jgi:hypothetical protein
MHAKHLQASAAVGQAALTCAACTAVQVGTHATKIAGFQMMFNRSRANISYFERKFVPQYAGIRKKRLPASESVQIGTANSNSPDAHLHLIHAGRRRLLGFHKVKLAGLIEDNRLQNGDSKVGCRKLSWWSEDSLSDMWCLFNAERIISLWSTAFLGTLD